MTARSRRLNDALARMAVQAQPGKSYSCAEIAEACGYTTQAIQVIEKKAMGKLRRLLRKIAKMSIIRL
jgi:DNA-directed RNA polymerase sigma subunit (sigma70/sigma32)